MKKKSTFTHITVKLQKTKDKDNLKSSQIWGWNTDDVQ
jgi:hypothetical protein